MGVVEIEAFLRRLMTDEAWRRRLLDEPEAVLRESGLNAAERWAVLEALWDSDEVCRDFLPLLRTRLALVGVPTFWLPRNTGQGASEE
ncbi:MAG: hypothetical protein C4290_05655 [Chloroflexota bacterium]